MLWVYSINSTIATKSQSYRELTHNLAINTSEFNVSSSVGKDNTFNIVFEWSCLSSKINNSFKILEELIFDPVFEKERIVNIFRSFTN
jgi:Zn-dependent M16 (insulinase) family peptidase